MYIDIYSSIIRDTFTISFIFPGVTQHQGQADQGQTVGPSTTRGIYHLIDLYIDSN